LLAKNYKPRAEEVKLVILVYARKAYRGNGGTAALILNLSTRWGDLLHVLGAFLLEQEPLVPTE
jgi:hypothetical protein